MSPRVVWMPRSRSLSVAGFRIRTWNVVRILRDRGWNVEISDGRWGRCPDIIVLSKRYDDDAISLVSKKKAQGARIVFDLFDNHFYNPNHLKSLQSASLNIRRMISLSDIVVASTEMMAAMILDYMGTNVDIEVIPDSYEEKLPLEACKWYLQSKGRLDIWKHRKWLASRPINSGRLVWFGIHGGANADYGMKDISHISPILNRLNEEIRVSLTVISNSIKKYASLKKTWCFDSRYVEWSACSFDDILSLHDICVIPIDLNPFTQVKTANRPVTALAHGVAVVADSIPSYEILKGGIRLGNWEQNLRDYLFNPEIRQQEIDLGRRIIEEQLSPDVVASRWEAVFDRVISTPI